MMRASVLPCMFYTLSCTISVLTDGSLVTGKIKGKPQTDSSLETGMWLTETLE